MYDGGVSNGNPVIFVLQTSIYREGDEFVGPFIAKLKGEVPEARVTTEVDEEGTERSAHHLVCDRKRIFSETP